MSKVADSLKLALANLTATALAFAVMNSRYAELAGVWLLVFVSPLFLLTVGFSVRDFFWRRERGQAALAVLVSIPAVLIVLTSHI